MLILLKYEQNELVIVFQRKILRKNFWVFRGECLWKNEEFEKTKTERVRCRGN